MWLDVRAADAAIPKANPPAIRSENQKSKKRLAAKAAYRTWNGRMHRPNVKAVPSPGKAIHHRRAKLCEPDFPSGMQALMSNRTLAESTGAAVNLFRRAVSQMWAWEARFKGVVLEGKLALAGRPIISVARGSSMVFGDGVTLFSAVRASPLGCFQPCVL